MHSSANQEKIESIQTIDDVLIALEQGKRWQQHAAEEELRKGLLKKRLAISLVVCIFIGTTLLTFSR